MTWPFAMQRFSTFLSSILAFVFVGTLFLLFGGHSAPKERSLGEIQNFKPDDPEYRAFYHNYQSFYGEGKEKEERRERLRQIQKQLESDPQPLILKEELATYHAWIKTVPEKRSDINQAKTIEDRLEAIRSIKEEQGRKQPNSNPSVKNLYPSLYELAEYLEDLESFDRDHLERLLGHPPGVFRLELEKDYRGAME